MRLFNHNCQMLGDNIQIHTIGCEASMSDAYNFACTLDPTMPAIVLGTCSFIEDRSLESIMLAKILQEAYPEHTLYVIGCDVNNHKDMFDFCDNVYSNEEVKVKISDRKIIEGVKIKSVQQECIGDPIINIKIQDGCNYKCTYCIINQLRNKPYSVPYDEIVKLIREQLVARPNYDRVVLSGTEVTSYHDEAHNYDISDLVKNLIKDIPEIKRLTMTAIDPFPYQVKDLLEVMKDNKDKIIPYLLLGVQSGSDTLLEKMRRRHRVSHIRELHAKAKEYGITLGWDIIVGFPGETDELFQETYDLMKELQPFTQNIFMYSDRKGTPASSMTDKVDKDTQIKRDRKLHELMFDYANNNPAFKPFEEYADEAVKYEQAEVNKRRAIEIMFNEFESRELYFNLLDTSEVANVIRTRPENTLFHVKYDMDRDVECEIVIDFLKNFMRGFPLIVHAPHEFADKYDVKDFENLFHCIVVLEDN